MWMNNPSLESYHVVVILCVWPLFMWYFCWRHNFFIDFRRNTSCGIIQAHSHPISCFWYTYWPPLGYQDVDLSESSKIRHELCVRGSAVQNLEEKCLSVKIWIIIKKISLPQLKTSGNNAIFFDILKKLLNSFQTSGDGFWDNQRFRRYRRNFNCQNSE